MEGFGGLGPGGLKHAAREGVLCGARCFSGIFKYLTLALPSALKRCPEINETELNDTHDKFFCKRTQNYYYKPVASRL